MELCFNISKMGRIFHKSWGNISYEILDEVAYERYWWGRRPSTKKAVEDWLGDPDRTQRSVEIEYGKSPRLIYLNMSELVKQEIIRRFKRED